MSQQYDRYCMSDMIGDVKALYEKATAAPLPSPPPTPQAKRTKADWERDERELAEESEARQDLRQHTIPPYFESEFGKAFLLSQVCIILHLECMKKNYLLLCCRKVTVFADKNVLRYMLSVKHIQVLFH